MQGILDHCKNASDLMPGDSQDLSQNGLWIHITQPLSNAYRASGQQAW